MTTTPPQNVLLYRNNGLWAELAEDLAHRATFFHDDPENPAKPGAEVTIQVFPQGTPESEIEAWIHEHSDMLKSARDIYSDETCLRPIVTAGIRKRYKIDNLNEAFAQASEIVFKKASPAESYRKILERLISAQGITQAVIVLDAIVDYNPLAIPEFDDPDGRIRKDRSMLVRYAELFKGLMPEGVESTFVNIEDLELPGEDTIVLVHHHALNGAIDAEKLSDCPRVMMPYPKGLIDKASKLCDLGGIMKDDFLDTLRRIIRFESKKD